MSLAGCQINPIDVNFHLQKVWKFLIKIQLTKPDPKRTRGKKCPPSCQLGLIEILARIIGHENWIRSHMNKWVAGRCWITNKDCRLQTGFPIYENFFSIIYWPNLGHCVVGRNYFFVPNCLNNGILAIMRRNQLLFRQEYLKNYERNSAFIFDKKSDWKSSWLHLLAIISSSSSPYNTIPHGSLLSMT